MNVIYYDIHIKYVLAFFTSWQSRFIIQYIYLCININIIDYRLKGFRKKYIKEIDHAQ